MKIIKDFLEYRKMVNSYQKIELKESEKNMLGAFDKEILLSIMNKTLENLSREMLSNNLSEEYVRGYKHWISHFITYFKKYN